MTEGLGTELTKIAAQLEDRGTTLRGGADDRALAQLEVAIGGPLSEQARALFSVFDGFEGEIPDHPTEVCIWSVDAIRRHAESHPDRPKGHAFGDYFLSADLFCCDLRDAASSVWWDEGGRVAASSLLDFCRQVADGTLEP